MNFIYISGNLGHTPEIKKTQSGISVVSGSIAVNETVNGNKTTKWFDFKAFRGTAELIAKYFAKGNKIGLKGKLDKREYTDRDGNNRTAVEILVDEVEFYGNANSQPAERAGNDGYIQMDDNGDLPF